jgi:hypothetical protein
MNQNMRKPKMLRIYRLQSLRFLHTTVIIFCSLRLLSDKYQLCISYTYFVTSNIGSSYIKVLHKPVNVTL